MNDGPMLDAKSTRIPLVLPRVSSGAEAPTRTHTLTMASSREEPKGNKPTMRTLDCSTYNLHSLDTITIIIMCTVSTAAVL